MQLRTKLPLLVVSGTLATVLALGVITYLSISQHMRQVATDNLTALGSTRQAALNDWFTATRQTLLVLARSSSVRNALFEMEAAWDAIHGAGEERLRQLQVLYWSEYSKGDFDGLRQSSDPSIRDYGRAHYQVHGWLNRVGEEFGYADVFLITLAGNVVYSRTKDGDFATNMLNGPWRNSGLGKVVGRIVGADGTNPLEISDFQRYEPSGGLPMAFAATPIREAGDLVGVLAVGLTVETLNHILHSTIGMGDTGETYLVGGDFFMRSDSRFSTDSTILRQKVRNTAVERALSGESGALDITNYRGTRVVSTYQPFVFHGLEWALLSEMAEDEIKAGVHALGRNIALIGAFVFVVLGMVGVRISRSIAAPLGDLGKAFEEFGRTRVVGEVPHVERTDEIGTMARGLAVATRELGGYIHEVEEARETVAASEGRLMSMLQNSPIGVLIGSLDGNTRLFVNARALEMFAMEHDVFMAASRDEYWADENQRREVDAQFVRDRLVLDREVEMRRSDGSPFWVLYTALDFDYGGTPARIAWIYDITQRKTVQEELSVAMRQVTQSIGYASRIQRSILPHSDSFSAVFAEHFVAWEPRDVVGGDIYWNRTWGDGVLVLLGDCTGHGVPGAFMTLIATGALDRAMEEVTPGNLGELVRRLHQFVMLTLNQHVESGSSDDGLELGACYLNAEMTELLYTGARFSLFVAGQDGIEEIKGTRTGIGYRGIPFDQEYAETRLALAAGRTYYMATDGYVDQVGGERRRMFGKKRFMALLNEIQALPLSEQKSRIMTAMETFQGSEPRRDDVAVIGFRVG